MILPGWVVLATLLAGKPTQLPLEEASLAVAAQQGCRVDDKLGYRCSAPGEPLVGWQVVVTPADWPRSTTGDVRGGCVVSISVPLDDLNNFDWSRTVLTRGSATETVAVVAVLPGPRQPVRINLPKAHCDNAGPLQLDVPVVAAPTTPSLPLRVLIEPAAVVPSERDLLLALRPAPLPPPPPEPSSFPTGLLVGSGVSAGVGLCFGGLQGGVLMPASSPLLSRLLAGTTGFLCAGVLCALPSVTSGIIFDRLRAPSSAAVQDTKDYQAAVTARDKLDEVQRVLRVARIDRTAEEQALVAPIEAPIEATVDDPVAPAPPAPTPTPAPAAPTSNPATPTPATPTPTATERIVPGADDDDE
jgi:hypothetical protein